MLVVTVVLCMAASSKFSFAGGGDFDLCRSLAGATKQPTVLLAEPSRKWHKADLSYDDFAELKGKVRKVFSLDEPTGKTWGLAGASYPEDFYFLQHRAAYGDAFKPVKAVVGGEASVVTISTPDGAVSLSGMLSVLHKKPVTWHWFFEGSMLVGDARGASEDAYLKCVADALGAKIVDRGTDYYLDFDASRYRARARALLADLSSETQPPVVSRLFLHCRFFAGLARSDGPTVGSLKVAGSARNLTPPTRWRFKWRLEAA